MPILGCPAGQASFPCPLVAAPVQPPPLALKAPLVRSWLAEADLADGMSAHHAVSRMTAMTLNVRICTPLMGSRGHADAANCTLPPFCPKLGL